MSKNQRAVRLIKDSPGEHVKNYQLPKGKKRRASLGLEVKTTTVKTLFSPLDREKTKTLAQLAEAMGVSKTTLRDWANHRRIPGAFRPTNGKGIRWRFDKDEVEQWWQQMKQNTP